MARSSHQAAQPVSSPSRGEDAVDASDTNETSNAEQEGQNTMAQDIAEQIKTLKVQVEALKNSLAEMGGKAGRAVESGASTASNKISSTVESYPLSTVVVVSVVAFLAGRATVGRPQTFSESAIDTLRDRLQSLTSHLPPHLKDSLRSSFR
jgi:hypothetical protein